VQATIDCLVELGYRDTTTAKIQARAGVSRGALTHHFSSKAELLLAAMEELYEQFRRDVRARAQGLPPAGRARLRDAIRLLWGTFDGPLFAAAMELWVAARTDERLREQLLPHERTLGAQLRRLAIEVVGDDVAHRPEVYLTLLTSMRGHGMTYALMPDAAREGPHLDAWFALVEASPPAAD
jgi:AcrR family transcriptional regulator